MQRRLVTHIHQALGYSVVVDDANDQFLEMFLPMMSQQKHTSWGPPFGL